MKKQLLNKFILLLIIFPFRLLAQPGSAEPRDITGLWKGELFNDTTQKHLPYELAISEEKGKLTGYSYTLFEIDGKKEMGVKKLKLKRKENKIVIEDLELIANTYSEPPARGVKWMGIVNLSFTDTSMELSGSWSTSPTREFRPVTGKMQLSRAINFRPLVLYKELVTLKLDQSLSFVIAEQKAQQDVAIQATKSPDAMPSNPPAIEPAAVKPTQEGIVPELPAINNIILTTITQNPKRVIIPVKIQRLKKERSPTIIIVKSQFEEKVNTSIAMNEPIKKEVKPAAESIKKTASTPVNSQPVIVKNELPKKAAATVKKGEKQQQEIVKAPGVKNPVTPLPVAKKPEQVAVTKDPVKLEVKTPVKDVVLKVDPPITKKALTTTAPGSPAAAEVAERKIGNTQEVFYRSDSLILTLYDNGEVDGDTVSVLMNGDIIFSRQGLTTKANSKVIYITPDTPDSLVLVMYAENLGSIPPNTGLLVVRDGEAVYDVRFRADLNSNAAIILRRRKRE